MSYFKKIKLIGTARSSNQRPTYINYTCKRSPEIATIRSKLKEPVLAWQCPLSVSRYRRLSVRASPCLSVSPSVRLSVSVRIMLLSARSPCRQTIHPSIHRPIRSITSPHSYHPSYHLSALLSPFYKDSIHSTPILLYPFYSTALVCPLLLVLLYVVEGAAL